MQLPSQKNFTHILWCQVKPEAYSITCQTFKMELFTKIYFTNIFNGFQWLIVFTKASRSLTRFWIHLWKLLPEIYLEHQQLLNNPSQHISFLSFTLSWRKNHNYLKKKQNNMYTGRTLNTSEWSKNIYIK